LSGTRIGREHYDASGYFEDGAGHLTDLASRFQRYRVENVLGIHRPREGDRVVDLGCGWGTFGFVLSPHVREVVGVDFSRKSIELCHRRRAESGAENLRFLCADAGDTGLDEGEYDVVIAADLFEHLYPEDSARVVAEAYRILRPGGYLSVWTPHRGHVLEILKNRNILLKRDVTHVDYKSMDRMKRLLAEQGFVIERAYYAPSHVPVLRWLEMGLQRVLPLLRRRIAVLGRKPPAGP